MIFSLLIMSSLIHGPTIIVSPPAPAKVLKYVVVEFAVTTDRTFRNPFDPNEIAVDGVFSLHDGTRIILPAFWDGKTFVLRFCPPKPGDWTLTTSVKTGGGLEKGENRRFHVDDSASEGFVKPSSSNPRYFQLGSGKTFVPIGLNLCWPDKSGLPSYEARFAKLQSVGGNFARIWTTQERRLETREAGLGHYDVHSAAFYDGVLEFAGKHGIRTMLTFDDYRVLAKTDYFNAHWDTSPYNAANGGPLKEPTDFFTDPLSRKLYKQRLRYLVARYTAYPSLAIWELYNEQDNIPKPGVPTEWFREMTAYLASIDPYHHPITTSYSWDDKPEVWESPAVGLTQRHLYGQGDTVDFVTMIEENSRKLDAFGKPRMIGEFGITWKEPDIALDKSKKGTPLHDALWASIMTGDSGGALTWWWDNYLEPLNLWPVFIGISRFVAPIDFAHRSFRPLPLRVQGLTALALQDATTGETLLWLHDPASNWKNDAEGMAPRQWENTTVELPATKPLTVEIWNTRTGEILSKTTAQPVDGTIAVTLPPFQRDVAIRAY
jgi:hypothetical protein